MAVCPLPWFPVYAAEMLADETFQIWDLDVRGAWFTLLAYAWKEGSIPADQKALSRLLNVDSSAMAELWLSLKPRFVSVAGHTDRLVSPRQEQERNKGLDLQETRSIGGAKGAKARWDKENARKMGDSSANGSPISPPNSSAMPGPMANTCPIPLPLPLPKETTPLTPQGEVIAETVSLPVSQPKQKRKRRTQEEIKLGYSEETRKVVNSVLDRGFWRKADPDGRIITPDPALLCANVQTILENHQEVTPELLIEAARNYMAKDKQCYSAPQYFFGPGKAGETPKWVAEVQYAAHQAQRRVEQEQARLDFESMEAAS